MELFVDTWEGQGNLDEDVMVANGVKAVITRINDMNGGHHMDEYFLTQWEQAKNMLRAVYFVYNPWVSGQANFDWLDSHMPADAKALAIDIEVRYDGITPAKYAQDVRAFYDLCKAKWRTVIYTGEWFLPYLSSWPTDAPYWWAQYPLSFYPSTTQFWTWNDVRTTLANYGGPMNASRCPGRILMWQFTGDRLILPGSSNKLDVNAYMGSASEMEAWFGCRVTQPPVVDEIYHTHPGVTVYKLIRFGCPVFVHVIDPKIAKVWVTGLDNKFKTVAQTATKYSAAVVTNGGGWPYNNPTWPNEVWKSKGVLLKGTALDDRPWVGITQDGCVTFGQGTPPSNVLDVVGYDRYLGQDGVFNPRYDPSLSYDNRVKDARTFSGRSRSGKFILCCAEGDDYDNYGLTFKEEWDILAEFDCDTGGNHDGGSSSGVVNKALGDGSLTKPSDPQLAYVINSIVVNSGSEGATITYLPKPEIWRLRNVEDWQGEDQPDTDQAGAGFSPTIAGTSGVSNWKQIGLPEMALIQRLNTGIDSFTWDRKKQWAIKDVAGWMYQSTTSNIDLPPWYDWNLIMGSRKPYGSQWNLVRVLARASNGFVMIDAIPKADNYDNILPDDIRIHRVNVTTNGVSRDTPVGIFNRPIFSPLGFKRAVGDLVGTGVWIPNSYLYQKVEETAVGEFDIKVTGVPKYYLGILTGYNNLNIRYEPNFGDAGENNTVAFAYRNSVWTADQEVINPNGDIWWRINKHGLWLCAYQASKGARGRYAVKV